MSRLVEVFCATQRHQKTKKNKKQKKRNADKGSHGFTRVQVVLVLSGEVMHTSLTLLSTLNSQS